jgi:outer membrane immunogenic protein
MKLQWHVLWGLGALVASAVPASATEPVPIGATQWGGFYVGGQLGGAWSQSDWNYENHNWFNTIGPKLVIRHFDFDSSGFEGGGQAGFNYRTGDWVLGIEGSLAGADLGDSIRSPFFPASDSYTTDLSWLSTVTGRVGYAFDRWLAYGKAGWAGADIDLTLFDHGTPVRASGSSWANGWTIGGGGEYALGGGLSLGVEYDYINLDTGNWAVSCPTCPPGLGGGVPVVSGDIAVQSVTGRLNYRFGK